MEQIIQDLFSMQDQAYKVFHEKLIPTMDPDTVIGVRTPELRKYARSLRSTETARQFLTELPHKYYEENNLHGFLIEQIRDFDTCIAALDGFLPFVDNWATCDMLRPKCFVKNRQALLPHIERWLSSREVYTVRYGIGMLLTHFLDDEFQEDQLARVAQIESREYYINMMIAWYFATALAKQYDAAIVYLEQGRLPLWVHNKTIQKACESYRITPEQKTFLRSLRKK